MQVKKVDDSLVVRLPDDLVRELDLKEGDEVDVQISRARRSAVESKLTREEALQILQDLSRPLPPDYKFNREELHER